MTTTKEAIEQNEITTPADFYDSWTDAYEFSRMGEELILLQEQLLSLRDLLENEATLKMFVPTLYPSLELSKKMVGDKMTETENSIKKLLEKRERHIERHVKEKEETKARNKRINDAYTEIRAALLFYLPDPIRDRVQFFSVSRDGFFVPFGDDEAITKRAATVDIVLEQRAYSAYQISEIKTAVERLPTHSLPNNYGLTQ